MIDRVGRELGLSSEGRKRFTTRYRGLYYDETKHPSEIEIFNRICEDVYPSDISDQSKAAKIPKFYSSIKKCREEIIFA